MSVLQQKAQQFVNALLKKCSERGEAEVRAGYDHFNNLEVSITLNGLSDTYTLSENNGRVNFIRHWNGVL